MEIGTYLSILKVNKLNSLIKKIAISALKVIALKHVYYEV